MLQCHKLSRPLRLNDVCVVQQGVLFGHNPLAFYALLGLIADMRKVGICGIAQTEKRANKAAYAI
jgi:hypothetical protein